MRAWQEEGKTDNKKAMEKTVRKTKQVRKAPAKTQEASPRKKFHYLKGYRELVPDPWGLGLES